MREKRNFGERAKLLPSDEARKKYFLVYEGKHHFTTFKFVHTVSETTALRNP